MKRFTYAILVLMLLLSIAGCSTPAEQTSEPAASEPAAASDVVVFTDAVLERMVREQMEKPEGDITLAEAAEVGALVLDLEWQREIPEETQIKDISALQYFVNLDQLSFNNHAVSDLSPLAGLVKAERNCLRQQSCY